jgi:hypothetical protein
MQIKHLFHLITDSSDLLDLFDQVETKDQLISRLEMLKRQDTSELLSCIEGLRQSANECLEDTIEPGGSLDADDDDDDLGIEAELEAIAQEEPLDQLETPAKPDLQSSPDAPKDEKSIVRAP